MNFSWTGRQLDTVTINNSTNIAYTYDVDGIRTKKVVNGVTTEYFVNGSTIIAQKTGNDIIWFIYDVDGEILGFTYNGTPYYYIKNLQGDVVAIVNSVGLPMGSYTYDPWGKIVSVSGTIAEINPIRYRGYYYDSETGLYYLNSRYYDPDTCRFINADGVIAGVGGDIKGYNLFTYCFNNPVNMDDGNGNWPSWNDINAGFKKAVGWLGNNIIRPINERVVQPVVSFRNDITEDIKNFDKNNESEQKVLDSNYFSCYKGVPTFRINGNRSGSFGAMFITRETSQRANPEDVVRHEYGHAVQFEQLGLVNYSLCIGLPSWLEWGSNSSYYDRPWEITADVFGGVVSRNPCGSDVYIGFKYLQASQDIGPLVWLFIE